MTQRKTVCLDFYSTYEILDFVQVASDHLGRLAGLDDDALHWVGVAVRESVINAIKHGNRDDERKHVYVEFTPLSNSGPAGIAIRVRDEGPGFDPTTIPDPLAPENVLKSSGRGIFIIRTFMDEMVLRRAPEGGMEVVMVKRVAAGDHRGFAVASALTPPDPVFLATAVEIVLRAGEIQMSRRESGFQIDKKGTIDLVTEVDLECEKMCRAVLAERFPHHDILAEELSSGPGQPYLTATAGYSIRSTGQPTTRTACPCSARRSRWRSTDVPRSARSTTRRGRSSSPANVVRVLL